MFYMSVRVGHHLLPGWKQNIDLEYNVHYISFQFRYIWGKFGGILSILATYIVWGIIRVR